MNNRLDLEAKAELELRRLGSPDKLTEAVPIDLEDSPCPLGCQADDDLVLVGRDRLHNLPGHFRVVQCSTCGLMRTNPRPTIQAIGIYYPEDYDPYIGKIPRTSIELLYKHLALQLLNMERVPPVRSGRMLEFGCSSGKFLDWMGRKGWQVTGVEVAEKPAKAAQALGYTVHICPLESAPEPPYPYDLVVGWNVLEHLHEPVKALRKLSNWTRQNGWLVVSVPNAAAMEFRLFGDAWFALDVPRHLYHFTPSTLTYLLRASGWEVVRIFHQRTFANLAGSIAYVLQDSSYADSLSPLMKWLLEFHSNGPMHFLTFPLVFPLSLLGQTGRMTIWARKLRV